RQEVHDAARRARGAARGLATLSTDTKNQALRTAADHILMNTRAVLEANEADLDAARAAGTPTAMLDRLA
ncbi:gamma-glutamyl-phosphate reductase, partial [Mycobacterium sp. ITM-2017-0098]